MKIKIIYFAYLFPDRWEPIVREQLDGIKRIGLYSECETIHMCVIAVDKELNKLRELLYKEYTKVEIKYTFVDNVYEYPGLKLLYESAKECCNNNNDNDTVFLYLHTKGMTSGTADRCPHYTRKLMFKYTIENYKEYIDVFENNSMVDVGGVIPHKCGFIYFNFFWVRASYISTYCIEPKLTTNRYIWEIWIGTAYSKKENVVTYSPFLLFEKTEYNVWDIHDSLLL